MLRFVCFEKQMKEKWKQEDRPTAIAELSARESTNTQIEWCRTET